MTQSDLYLIGVTQLAVGLSAIFKFSPANYQYAENFKIQSGGGTLEIVNAPLALSGASAVGWGTGYQVGANEVVSVQGPATMYFAATGQTMVIAMLLGYTSPGYGSINIGD